MLDFSHCASQIESSVFDGEAQNFEEIYRKYSRLICRTAHSVLGNREDAEDVLQTIFLRLLRRDSPANVKSNPKAYLYRAAVNLSLNTIRSRAREVLVANAADFKAIKSFPVDPSVEEQMHERLSGAIAALPPAAAQIVILRYIHNYSDAEIAKLRGTSRTSIAARLFRSRARLKKLIHG